MKSLHASPQAARLAIVTFAAMVLLLAVSSVAAATPVGSDQFVPGWQAHARPLINMGISRIPGRERWQVPAILPRGDYVLVKRSGDKAELIDGYRFTVKGGVADEYLFLEPGYGSVEALPVADVPAVPQRERADWVQ